jgi:hypothetical protein
MKREGQGRQRDRGRTAGRPVAALATHRRAGVADRLNGRAARFLSFPTRGIVSLMIAAGDLVDWIGSPERSLGSLRGGQATKGPGEGIRDQRPVLRARLQVSQHIAGLNRRLDRRGSHLLIEKGPDLGHRLDQPQAIVCVDGSLSRKESNCVESQSAYSSSAVVRRGNCRLHLLRTGRAGRVPLLGRGDVEHLRKTRPLSSPLACADLKGENSPSTLRGSPGCVQNKSNLSFYARYNTL